MIHSLIKNWLFNRSVIPSSSSVWCGPIQRDPIRFGAVRFGPVGRLVRQSKPNQINGPINQLTNWTGPNHTWPDQRNEVTHVPNNQLLHQLWVIRNDVNRSFKKIKTQTLEDMVITMSAWVLCKAVYKSVLPNQNANPRAQRHRNDRPTAVCADCMFPSMCPDVCWTRGEF